MKERKGKGREKMKKGGREAEEREGTSLVTFRSTKTSTQYLKNDKWRSLRRGIKLGSCPSYANCTLC